MKKQNNVYVNEKGFIADPNGKAQKKPKPTVRTSTTDMRVKVGK